MPVNAEVKARTNDVDRVRRVLEDRSAFFQGIDHQKDTYYAVPHGRLKLREGNIERSLIFYDRQDGVIGPRVSNVSLFRIASDEERSNSESFDLGVVLSKALGVSVVVKKTREIYFVGNIKFHIDTVESLEGGFVEIEAICSDGTRTVKDLEIQCQEYMDLFHLRQEDLLLCSYADLVMEQKKQTD